MLNKKNSYFDERQVEIRNKIGHQSFLMLYFLLMVDLLLEDYGVKWAASPTSTVIIMLSCFGYYLIRIVRAGAYTSERYEKRKNVYLMFGLLAGITTFIAITEKTNLFKKSLNITDDGLLQLLLFFFVFFTIVVVSNYISRRKNNGGNE